MSLDARVEVYKHDNKDAWLDLIYSYILLGPSWGFLPVH